jgi:thiosulfate/3-mercaptopyruvate sulfurtransferase
MSATQTTSVLVSTDWASNHLDDSGVQFVEVDVDTDSYDQGHIPGSVGWNWKTQLQDQTQRTISKKEDFEQLLSQSGISNDTTIVLYGDNNNWFAAWAYWLLKYYGHEEVFLIDGGKKKWTDENRSLTKENPDVSSADYTINAVNSDLRAFRDRRKNIRARSWLLKD